jgi:hypothetical protein
VAAEALVEEVAEVLTVEAEDVVAEVAGASG